jgi:hypothetical protein
MNQNNMNLFISYYIGDVLDISNEMYKEDSTETRLDSIDKIRNKHLEYCNLNSDDLYNNQDMITESLDELFKKEINEANLTNEEILKVFILREKTLSKNDLEEYMKVVKSAIVENKLKIYEFGHILGNNEKDQDFKNALFSCFKSLESKDKAELLANISIFLEHYIETPEGRSFIDKYDSESTLDDKKEWFMDLFKTMNKCSLTDIFNTQKLNKNLELTYSTESGGQFDGFYFIEGRLVTQQLQVSATADSGTVIEDDSIYRHALASVLISYACNKHILIKTNAEINAIEEKKSAALSILNDELEMMKDQGYTYDDDDIIELNKKIRQTQYDYDEIKPDFNLTEQNQRSYILSMKDGISRKDILKSLEKEFGHHINYEKTKDQAKNIKTIISKLTKNPHHVMNKIKGNQKNLFITKKDLKYFQENTGNIQPKVFFFNMIPSQHNKRAIFERSTLSEDINFPINTKSKKIKHTNNNLNMDEFITSLQLMAIISCSKRRVNLEDDAFEDLTNSLLQHRSATRLNTIDSTIFEDKPKLQAQMEKIVYTHFFQKSTNEIAQNIHALGNNAVRDNLFVYLKQHIGDITDKKNLNQAFNESGFDITADTLFNKFDEIKTLIPNSANYKDFVSLLKDKRDIVESNNTILDEKKLHNEKDNTILEQSKKLAESEEKNRELEKKIKELESNQNPGIKKNTKNKKSKNNTKRKT